MPWEVTKVQEERMKFITLYLDGQSKMAELCRQFNISRKTGYKYKHRYEKEGIKGLENIVRAPKCHPNAISEGIKEKLLEFKRQHPKWGAKKIRILFKREYPQLKCPAKSSIEEIFKKNGLVKARSPFKNKAAHPSQELTPALACNDVWQIDFKGWFRTLDGKKCHNLNLIDSYSRYLLCSRGFHNTKGEGVKASLEDAFKRYGMPKVICSDNGTPFACAGFGGITQLSLWLISLGISPERIKLGKPQENGRIERLHRTIGEELLGERGKDLEEQEKKLEEFRLLYNEVRPHEGINFETPSMRYKVSQRSYENKVEEKEMEGITRRVRTSGTIKWRGQEIYVGTAAKGKWIKLQEAETGDLAVYYGKHVLAVLAKGTYERKLEEDKKKGGNV